MKGEMLFGNAMAYRYMIIILLGIPVIVYLIIFVIQIVQLKVLLGNILIVIGYSIFAYFWSLMTVFDWDIYLKNNVLWMSNLEGRVVEIKLSGIWKVKRYKLLSPLLGVFCLCIDNRSYIFRVRNRYSKMYTLINYKLINKDIEKILDRYLD